jgi:hypothetical protein
MSTCVISHASSEEQVSGHSFVLIDIVLTGVKMLDKNSLSISVEWNRSTGRHIENTNGELFSISMETWKYVATKSIGSVFVLF